jgi:hypothetical protein|tara:strand:+ start:4692 stop:5993 length:1302 start_codon:yes stop_codon:yes gene_type:complete
MSYKIADFTTRHKVSYAQGNSVKYATAVKIGNTGKYGWHEHGTPTDWGNLHTYLDFNGFHPYTNQKCLKSARTWKQWAWSGKYSSSTGFNQQSVSLFNDHAPLTNRNASRCFGNKFDNKFNSSHFLWNRTSATQCEVERKGIPHVGDKYNVSFWMKANSAKKYDLFHYYQNNQHFPFNGDLVWRFGNNLASNKLNVQVMPTGSSNETSIFVYQTFVDYSKSEFKTYWYNGITTNIPINKWVFVNVSINNDKMFVAFNKNVASSKEFRYEDLSSGSVTINKKVTRAAEWSGVNPGRNYNFSDVSDKDRLHGVGVKSNVISISDFRVYSNVFVSSPFDGFMNHIQNHRTQVGDLPANGNFAEDNTIESEQVDFHPDVESPDQVSDLGDLQINDEGDLTKAVREFSDKNGHDSDFVENMILPDESLNIDFSKIQNI